EVDVVGPEPPEAGLNRGNDAPSAPLRRVGLVVVQVLRGDHGLVAPAPERRAQERLGSADPEEGGDAVLLCRVEQVDAMVEGRPDDAIDSVLVAPRSEEVGAEAVATDPDDRD